MSDGPGAAWRAVERDDRQGGEREGLVDLGLAGEAAQHDEIRVSRVVSSRQAGHAQLAVELTPVRVCAGDDVCPGPGGANRVREPRGDLGVAGDQA